MVVVGLLSTQGARLEHMSALERAGHDAGLDVEVRPLRSASDLTEDLDALVLPGGESTTMRTAGSDVIGAVATWCMKHPDRRVLGTCAGAMLCGDVLGASGRAQWLGGQTRASFEAELRTVVGGEANFHGVFIRAPRFSDEGSAQPIAWFEDEVVGVRDGSCMALTFHPELTDDSRFHRWVLGVVE